MAAGGSRISNRFEAVSGCAAWSPLNAAAIDRAVSEGRYRNQRLDSDATSATLLSLSWFLGCREAFERLFKPPAAFPRSSALRNHAKSTRGLMRRLRLHKFQTHFQAQNALFFSIHVNVKQYSRRCWRHIGISRRCFQSAADRPKRVSLLAAILSLLSVGDSNNEGHNCSTANKVDAALELRCRFARH